MTLEQKTKMKTRLKQLRTDKGLKQGDFGKLLNISASTISGYETGAYMPTLDFLMDVSIMFDISIDYLTGRSDGKKGILEDEENKLLSDVLITPAIQSKGNKIEALENTYRVLSEQLEVAMAEMKVIKQEIDKKKSEETQENDT